MAFSFDSQNVRHIFALSSQRELHVLLIRHRRIEAFGVFGTFLAIKLYQGPGTACPVFYSKVQINTRKNAQK